MRKPHVTPAPLVMALVLGWAGCAPAQTPPPPTVHVSIAAMPLAQALNTLARQANLELSFPADLVADKRAPAVSGELSVRQALDRLLAGSGLEAFVQGTAVTVRARPTPGSTATLAPVTVVANGEEAPTLHLASPMASGALGSRTQLDTPFSTAIVTADELATRQVNSVTDAFAHDPSIVGENPIYTIWGTQLNVRGLTLDTANGYKINGLPVYSMGLDIPYEQLDSIQLLKGLSGFMYGFGAPGGIVNFVTKRPGDEPVRSVEVGVRSGSIWTEHVDIGSRYTADDRFGYRLNATHEEGRTYNDGQIRRDSVSLGLAARLTPDLSWSLDVLHQQRRTTGQVSALDLFSYEGATLPRAIAGDAHLATTGAYNDTRLNFVSTGLDYRINPDWSVSGKVGYSEVTSKYVKDFNSLLDTSGNYDVNLLGGSGKPTYRIGQLLVSGKAATGTVKHELNFGAETQSMAYRSASNGFYDTFGSGSLLGGNPVIYTGSNDWQLYRAARYEQKALFASDTISFSSAWSLLAGLRYTNYTQNNYAQSGEINSSYRKNGVVTPTVALMFKPAAGTTLYASYVEALEPGGVVGDNYANANELLKPLKSKQYEVGAKTETDGWSASAALFRIERGAAYANDANMYVQNGLALYQGLDASGSVKVNRDFTLGGGLMLLDAQYRRGTDYDGNRVSGKPRVAATVFADYAVPQLPGLRLYANAKFTSRTYADDANLLALRSQTLIGAGASYATRVAGRGVTYQLSVANLTNRRGWVGGSSQIIPLAPRTVALNAKLDF